ncbi:hypothetical protein ATG_09100 [Desulfurococcaceae archaeon AG1]|jgi:hypothetical protein|nr:MAG: hypothetical protein DJ555_03905 [Desulfurococcaceae archaeon]GAY25707.1 hypothetical protein ATG_09100 [Desulfurococcaceae archaeon AG1]
MSQQTKSKELKIVTKPVIALDHLKSNKRALKTLFIISELGGVTEKALAYIIRELQSVGIDLGYSFVEIAGIPTSKDLREDIIAMLYVGLLESGQNKKLSVTSQGKEFLAQISIEQEFIENLKSKLPEVKNKLATLLAEADLGVQKGRRYR